MKKRLGIGSILFLTGAVLAAAVLCVCLGSVRIPPGEVLRTIADGIAGKAEASPSSAITLRIRLPRVLCAMLSGAALSLCGCAMQGLLRNPLADGSTMGVASGASLGAAAAILTGFSLPGLPFAGTMIMAILFAFLSLMLILSLAWSMDRSLSTHTIILIGIIFSMFVSSVMNLLVTFSGEKLRSITFWTMGSFSGSSYLYVLILLGTLAVCGGGLILLSGELNAFSLGERNASHLGVEVRRVRMTVLVLVSVMTGVCVSVGGSIAFVGLVVPHITRMITGPNHYRLMPACAFAGAVFLMLCDLCARILLSPLELPVGVVTSMIGAAVFVVIFYRTRKKRG